LEVNPLLPGDERASERLDLIINSFHYRAFPSVGVNMVWVGIAAFTMARKRSAVKMS
jgi:hypothetical protein